MAYCMNCGQQLPEGAKFCTKKPIPKRDFLKQFEDNFGVFKKIMYEEEKE